MGAAKNSAKSRKAKRLAVVSVIKGPIAFMHHGDIGKLVARGSKRAGRRLKPNYAVREDGVDTVKVLMATDTVISFEAFRPKGAVDTAHQHPDHHRWSTRPGTGWSASQRSAAARQMSAFGADGVRIGKMFHINPAGVCGS